MTSYEDFQCMLDLHPYDHSTRLILADWLEDHNNTTCLAWREMGRQRIVPNCGMIGYDLQKSKVTRRRILWSWSMTITGKSSGCLLKERWYNKLSTSVFNTRQLAEEAAVKAYMEAYVWSAPDVQTASGILIPAGGQK